MADDLLTMKARIADELKRDDLTSQIATAIADAVKFYQSEWFGFNESRDLTFPTVIDQEFYTSADLAAIATIMEFEALQLIEGSNVQTLSRSSSVALEVANQVGTLKGEPSEYAYINKKIRLSPIPNAVWTLRITGHITYAAPASDGEAGNPWMIEAEILIRQRAKYDLMLNQVRNVQRAQVIATQVTEAFDNLKTRANQLHQTGRIKPTSF